MKRLASSAPSTNKAQPSGAAPLLESLFANAAPQFRFDSLPHELLHCYCMAHNGFVTSRWFTGKNKSMRGSPTCGSVQLTLSTAQATMWKQGSRITAGDPRC